MRKLFIAAIILGAFICIKCTATTTETIVIETVCVTATSPPLDVWGTVTAVALSEEAEEKSLETQIARPLPGSLEEAKDMHSIWVEAGVTASEIMDVYGDPSEDEMLENFTPRVRRLLTYEDLGLTFGLTRDQLSDINVSRKYDGSVFGLRVGDTLQRAKSIYGDGFDTFKTGRPDIEGEVEAYFWPEILPNWFFYVQDDHIVEILMHDEKYYGTWEVESAP